MNKICLFVVFFAIIGTLLIPSALADDFSIRGGITFGMLPDEISEIEKETNGNKYEGKDGDYYVITYSDIDSVAGIPAGEYGVRIKYMFDLENKALNEIEYYYGYYGNEGIKYYDELHASIISKYGDPAHDNDGDIFPLTTSHFISALDLVSHVNTTSISNYSQWIVPYDDYYVLIDLYSISKQHTNELYLGYKEITNEEMALYNVILESKEQEQQEQINSDL